MRMLNELAEYPLMKKVRGSDTTDDEQVQSSSKASHGSSNFGACFHAGRAWQWPTGAVSTACVAERIQAPRVP